MTKRATGVDVWAYRRVGAGVELLLLHRVDGRKGSPGFWQGVSGGVEAGESVLQAAVRELLEETGLRPRALFLLDALFTHYAHRKDELETVVPFAAEVDAGERPTLSDEHDEYRWETIERAEALLPYEGQRAALRRLRADILAGVVDDRLFRVSLPHGDGA